MARPVAVCFLFALISSIASAQNPPQSDPQALALAAKSVVVMTGGTAVTDVTLTGSVTLLSETDSQKGTITLMAKGIGESRVDLSLSDLKLSDIRNDTAGYPQGASVVNGSDQQAWAVHNCWINASWFFPALSVLTLTSDPTVVFSYIGQEKRNEASVEPLQIFKYVTSKDQDAANLAQKLSTTDIYLDSASLLPAALTFNAHPDADAMTNIAIEIDLSNYQSFTGVQVPTRVQKTVSGSLSLDVAVTGAVLNSGLPDEYFAISEDDQK